MRTVNHVETIGKGHHFCVEDHIPIDLALRIPAYARTSRETQSVTYNATDSIYPLIAFIRQ